MNARDELFLRITETERLKPSGADELLDARDAEVRREWAAKIREVGTAKGWSTWAAAFLDPDVEFVDTGMPSTETIVAELRRLDRVATVRGAADALEAQTCDCGCRRGAGLLRQLAADIERGKDTSAGCQPHEGESTPASAGETVARATDGTNKPGEPSQ